MLEFFNIIKDNWIGLVVGIVAAALISLVIGFTAFKNNKLAGGIISLLLVIVFALSGMFIQATFFSDDDSYVLTPGEVGTILDTTIKDNWINTNGGFTFEQILAAQDDDECPTYEDQIIELKLHDFGGYVAFSYNLNDEYQNAIFLKTSNGLIYDGMLNMTGNFMKCYWEFIIYCVDLESWEWHSHKDVEPYYFTEAAGPGGYKYDDLVSASQMDWSFMEYDHFFRKGQVLARNLAVRYGVELAAMNISDYFTKYGVVELVGTKDTASRDINTFYNYLYDQIKGNDYGQSKLIDCTGLMCVPIPEDLQKNYPVSEEFKEQFPDTEYYGVYNCDVAVDLQYVEGNKQISIHPDSYDYIDENKDKDIVAVDPVETKQDLTKVTLSFVDTGNSNLTNVDLEQTPVTIQFTADEIKTTKTVIVDSLSELQSGVDVIFNSNIEWDYTIDSDALLFEDFMGSFTPKGNPSIVKFEYYYMDNYTIVNVGLNPIGTIDASQINLTQYPVRIILTNESESYQFLFDSNSQLNSYVSQLMPLGEYEYTVLSEQLIFSAVTGKLTITTTDNTMLFNYAQELESGDLDFSLTYLSDDPVLVSSSMGSLSIYATTDDVAIIRSHLSGSLIYDVILTVYDKDGKLLENLTHVHNNSGRCTAVWNPTLLVDGTEYIAQLRFSDTSDPTKTYLSDILTFTYSSSRDNCFRYDVEEVA